MLPLAWALVCSLPPASCPAQAGDASVELRAWCDLPRDDDRSHGLSGIVWDARAGRLVTLRDHPSQINMLQPTQNFTRWSWGATIDLGLGDTEAIALDDRSLLVADEGMSEVVRVGPGGALGERLPVPPHFAHPRFNKGLEALAATPDRRAVVFATEQALPGDGPVSDEGTGTMVRIARLEVANGKATEHAYLTDPAPGKGGDVGVSDVAALSSSQLLVTERGYQPGQGNRVRIYRVDLDGGADVTGCDHLGPGAATLKKTLFIDLSTLPDCGVAPPPAPQSNRLLANIEGVALGPRLPDGRQIVFLVADDNWRATQVARLLVLAIRI